MKVSLLLPVWNLEERLQFVLAGFFSQQLPDDWELIVCDDASTDKTVSILERYRNRKGYRFLVNQKNEGRAYTRNRLADEASGEWLLFVDGDCKPGPYFYKAWNRTLEERGRECWFGQVRYDHNFPSGFNRFLDYGSGADKLGEGEIPHQFFTSAHFAVTSKLWSGLDGFNDEFKGWGGEDFDLGIRISKSKAKINYTRQSHVKHPDIIDIERYLERLEEFGFENLGKLNLMYPEENVFHVSLLNKLGVKLIVKNKLLMLLLKKIIIRFDRLKLPYLFYRVLFLSSYGVPFLKKQKGAEAP